MNLKVEQVTIKSEEEIWIIDLKSNGLEYNKEILKGKLINTEVNYLELVFKIVDIIFFTYVKDKIVLFVKETK